MFKCDVILAHGKEFQSLFWAVKKAKHGQDFETVQPQGSLGDGGNDGYLVSTKHYFQLYSPVKPTAKDKIKKAVTKLRGDFAKLKKDWDARGGIAVFSFVYNDKYEGMPKAISQELGTLRKAHPGVTFFAFSAADLELDFMGLPDSEWDGILGGPVPDLERLAGLDYSVLAAVVKHVMACDFEEAESRLELPPELDDKIQVNKLSEFNARKIRNGANMTRLIDRYFEGKSIDEKGELKDRVVSIYERAKKVAAEEPPPDGASPADVVFKLFRRGLCPKTRTVPTAAAVDAVIGYFFEVCDVFDPKPSSKGLPGASP